MSNLIDVCAALESAIASMPSTLAISSENIPYTPEANVPYQRVSILFAQPDDPEIGGQGIFREQGVLLISLQFPRQLGKGASLTYAQLLRDYFKRGTSFVKNNVTVTIDRTPQIAPGMVDGDRWATPVRIRFYSNVG